MNWSNSLIFLGFACALIDMGLVLALESPEYRTRKIVYAPIAFVTIVGIVSGFFGVGLMK